MNTPGYGWEGRWLNEIRFEDVLHQIMQCLVMVLVSQKKKKKREKKRIYQLQRQFWCYVYNKKQHDMIKLCYAFFCTDISPGSFLSRRNKKNVYCIAEL